MKLKKITIPYVLIMIVLLISGVLFVRNAKSTEPDMVYYQGKAFEISEKLNKKINTANDNRAELTEWINAFQEEYSCSILFINDENYELQMNKALKQDALIMDYMVDSNIMAKIIWDRGLSQADSIKSRTEIILILIWIVCLLLGLALILYCYKKMIVPFKEINEYTAHIAKGELDFPLPVRRDSSYIGYLESFDIMREELKIARENEMKANQSKKELVAELSHDIKTPVATIKATCELMNAKDISEDEKNKLSVIEEKADTIYQLIDNLFNATLEELEQLKVTPVEISTGDIRAIIQKELIFNNVHIQGDFEDCLVWADPLRFEQVMDNLINNSLKYAKTDINIELENVDRGILVRVSDSGPGVPSEELHMVCEKYYRASNSSGEKGSGLGLYLTSLFIKEMRGQIEYYNDQGFVVELFLAKV